MAESLYKYIQAARNKKVDDEQIKAVLIKAGWPEDQINQALKSEKEDDSLIPPPPPPPVSNIGMWTGFLYIIFFISLYILATSVGGVFHEWIDKVIPLPANDANSYLYDYRDSILKGYISAIIVSYPIFAGLAIYLKKQLVKQPLVENLKIRKILIYITLIITFLISIGHIIFTIYDYLNGNIQLNAFGHLIITVIIAGFIFGYYLTTIIHDRKTIR